MKKILFIVNVDWFFDSHRRPLELLLKVNYETLVFAGNSGFNLSYKINYFQIKSRVPTFRGIIQLYKMFQSIEKDTQVIVVSPVMIFVCHFLFSTHRNIIYNFSGLGFLRSRSKFLKNLLFYYLKWFPVKGKRVFVVQNHDDYDYLFSFFKNNSKFCFELIPGSGFESNISMEIIPDFSTVKIGFVGRIRKDKGIMNLIRAVNELVNEGFKIDLVIWGQLDNEGRHGFTTQELGEMNSFPQFFKGYSRDKYEIYSSFNLFCLPSNGEGLSKAAIEAASYGLPLVLSNVQGNRDMIEGNGFLFEYSDLDSLKQVLFNVCSLSEDQLKFMSNVSRSMFEERWTLKAIYNKWNSLLMKYDITSIK